MTKKLVSDYIKTNCNASIGVEFVREGGHDSDYDYQIAVKPRFSESFFQNHVGFFPFISPIENVEPDNHYREGFTLFSILAE